MTLQIGVLTVKGMAYHPTRRLAEAAEARGARVVAINPYEVMPAYLKGRPFLRGKDPVPTIQALLPRQGAEIKTACLPLIEHYDQLGVSVINGLRSIQLARNKFFMLQALEKAGIDVPDTIFATTVAGCRQARDYFAPDPAVLKPVSGRQGKDVHRLDPQDPMPQGIQDQLASGKGVLVQAFLPPQERMDYRVLVTGKTVAGAMMLEPPKGDFRANFHLGGQPGTAALTRQMADLAVEAAQAMALDIAGVDLMRFSDGALRVVEVNSAPGFKALEAITGNDIAGLIVDYVLSACSK